MTRLDLAAVVNLDALADALAPLVAARLGAAGPTYTSLALPPGIRSRRRFASECRRLRIGRREGKLWIVTAADWHAARRAPAPAPRASTTEDRADAALRASGLRLVRGAR